MFTPSNLNSLKVTWGGMKQGVNYSLAPHLKSLKVPGGGMKQGAK